MGLSFRRPLFIVSGVVLFNVPLQGHTYQQLLVQKDVLAHGRVAATLERDIQS